MAPVSASKKQAIDERLKKLGVREEDLSETFVRSRGKGGQNVNKVSTCVVLIHLPSGMSVKCQRERTQAMNRYRARVVLADKIERRLAEERGAEAARVARVRRQKARRSRRAKEKILEEKRARSRIKAARARVEPSAD